MTGKGCEGGAQGVGCLVRSRGGLFIALELGHFTMVKGNKFASLAPKVESVSEIHISHKEMRYCGCRRVGFGSCARKMCNYALTKYARLLLKQRHNDRLR